MILLRRGCGAGAVVLLCLGLLGCDAPLLEFGGPTMGSSYSVKYLPGARGPTVVQAQAATEAILAEVDQQLSTYRDDSLIARFNALPAHSCQPLPAEVLALVAFGEQLSQQSGGAFDMTLEPLLNLWGFGPQARGERVPTASEIAAARLQVGHQHVHIDGRQLCKDAAVALDFNSIAAGYAVDRIATKLGELGVGS
ncbi:MAG: FAD:protein FMN transferase, partial [Pseudomonas sp.]|nr:FAD:protein FMN transferase [Pseudomonas sp.]